MKKTFIFAAAAALSIFASCQKEEIEAPSTDSNGDLVFTATIDNQDSKTTVNALNGKVAWAEGDTITITDAAEIKAKYSVTAMEGDTLAIFTKVKGEAKLGVGPYTAVYGTDPAVQQIYSATVPALPMRANSETTRLKFTVTCGLLELYLKAGEKVTSIYVSGVPTGATTMTYTLSCPEPVDIAEGDTFYVALPAGEYWDILIYGEHGAQCAKCSTEGSGIDIKANHITPVSFKKDLHFMVQLWEDGPYFATTNIGAYKPEDYGQYFAWGHPTGQTPSGTTFSKSFDTTNYPDVTTSPLDTTNDMAAKNWGKGWSVPTDDDFKALISADSNKCSVTYVTDGIKVAGKGDYASHSIFLPVAGCGDGSTLYYAGDWGFYWSSVHYDDNSDYAYYSGFNPVNDDSFVNIYTKCSGCSVRPVYRTAPDPKPAVPVFSVSAEKKVQFTKGNLYWNGSESEWHLEASQTAYPSSWDADHVGHFFWTNKTDYQSGTAEYMPYAKDYNYSSQSKADEFFCGVNNPLTVDGQSGLYALSWKEWEYLLSSETSGGRGDGDSKFKNGVEVCGSANCLVIAPDEYKGTIAATYTAEAWATAEAEGLVCLPAAKNRACIAGSLPSAYGYYWMATPLSETEKWAFSLKFSSGNLDIATGVDRKNGYAVRLVYDYKAE